VKREWAAQDGRGEFPEAHGALEDAVATGEVLLKMMELVGYRGLLGFTELVKTSPGEVLNGEVARGASARGKIAYPNLEQIPSEEKLESAKRKFQTQYQMDQGKRASAEDAKEEFLKGPSWSTMRVTQGTNICFTQLVPWDDTRDEGFDDEVHKIAEELGLVQTPRVRSDLELLIINDLWVADSAKLRDALARGIAVTTYSVFQENNPEFPVWRYRKAWQYKRLKKEGYFR